jgi:hypothetical protein
VTAARAVLAIALLLAAGCRTLPTPVPLPADDPRLPSVMAAFSEVAVARRTLRGIARLAVDSDNRGVRVRGKMALVLERPARLRAEVLGLLGQTVGVLVIDGERFEWFGLADRSYETGVVYPELLWDRVGVPLAAHEVVGLVLGEPVPRPGLLIGGASDLGDGWIQVDLADARDELRERVAFDAEGRLRRLEVLARPGVNARRVRLHGYETRDGVAFAREIDLEFPGLDVQAELSFGEVELNPILSPEVFRLRLPGVNQPASGDGG